MPPEAPARPVRFDFDGRAVAAVEGQSVAAALLAAGVTTLSRSPKYRRPRGIHCGAGACPNCLVTVDGRPHVRACMTPAREGLRVATQGSTADRVDPKRLIDAAGKLFPVGFQYRWFKRQNALWRLWEGQLRASAAEVEVPAAEAIPPAQRMRADLIVVGAGPAGIAAAAAASEAGLRVVLASRRAVLGGGLRAALRDGTAPDELRRALEVVEGSARVVVLAPGTVVAGFGGDYLVDAGDRLVEVTARASVLATGAYERALRFPGNDRPGAMLTSALCRLALEDRVLADRTVVVATRDDEAYAMARDLIAAGTRVVALLDERPRAAGDLARQLAAQGAEVVAGARVTGVVGRGAVRGVRFEAGGATRTLRCDFIGMSGGWQTADELRYAATSGGMAVVEGERAQPLADAHAAGGELPVLQAVGAVAGRRELASALADGARAGRWAAEASDG